MVDEYHTGNSVPSSAMPDAWDNNATIDAFVNSQGLKVKTRTGIERDTMSGMQKKFDDQLTQQRVDFDVQHSSQSDTFNISQNEREETFSRQLSEQESIFESSQADKENRFASFLDSSGYVFLGEYQNGPFQFSARNQYIRYNNQYYRLNAATDVGFTTTGTDATSFANDVTHFVMMDGDTLRQNLGSGEEGMGGDLVTVKKGRAPEAAYIKRSVSDMLLDGEAGLRKCFGGVGDGDHDDTDAFNEWWECLMEIAYKRRAYEGDEAAIKFMLQKGPLLTIENGVFIYDGPGLNIGNSDVFVFNVKGESALSTKILLPNDGVYLFDFDNNPVHSRLSDMTIHGGLGAARYKSKARNASSTHDFERLRLSRYNECGISNN
ncbi:hypothetical protein RAG52_18065, partial [Klebsiella pneumoniae]